MDDIRRFPRHAIMTGRDLLGLSGLQWVALVIAVLALFVTAEAWLGHLRTDFRFRVQYVALGIGGLLAGAAVGALMWPGAGWMQTVLRAAGGVAAVGGLIGMLYHHWYGMTKQPAGYRLWLHHVMYGAPQLAPLALTVLGALAFVTAHALTGEPTLWGLPVWRVLLWIAAVGLGASVVQAGFLHYRGAFNTPLMYVPLVIPPLAVIGSIWMAAAPSAAASLPLRAALWLTFLTGFVGLGMHLRGLDRQMGGLHLALFNLLQGPPPVAPAVFAGLAAVGLAAIELVR